jgi:hypothetical protein
VIRFVDSRFERDRTMEEIRRLFPDVRNIADNSMPLREIFVALAKSQRQAN